MQSTIEKLPAHLKRYVVDQNYAKYTPEDQAIWRYILRQLKGYLKSHAHPAYITGLEKTGISEDEIPHIETMDEMLKDFGWSAVPISGFIPPAAFMEFQSLGILPIATDLRSIDHIHYTPAPDIVHESAGHAPILIDQKFSKYLKEYASIASNAIFSKEDLDVYEAIRELSDLKEDPASSDNQVEGAESNLKTARDNIRYVSEAALLSRMNWWTAEYGLIGSIDDPKIFGAGLLSSIGEARSCLKDDVKKLPLSIDCIQATYDITEKQPQLFVTKDFDNLVDVLHQLSDQMAYKRGGEYGLKKAIESGTVNTIELNSGLQCSGLLSDFRLSANGEPCFIKLAGPTQLSVGGKELPSHGVTYHKEGFSSPIGLLKGHDHCLSTFSDQHLADIGLTLGANVSLQYESGISVSGVVETITRNQNKLVTIAFSNCSVTFENETLFNPDWGTFDLAVGSQVTSVFGGAADRQQFGETIDFVAKTIPPRSYSKEEVFRHFYYKKIKTFRLKAIDTPPSAEAFEALVTEYLAQFDDQWLIGVQLFEIAQAYDGLSKFKDPIAERLHQLKEKHLHLKVLIDDGIETIQRLNT